MMGERRVMQEALFYGFSLERHVPDDHLLRKIDRFLDLSEVRAHLGPYYSDVGRPSIDPELMIRMLIVGYCFGIRSERRLREEVHLNLAHRWFCRLGLDGEVPDQLRGDDVGVNVTSPLSLPRERDRRPCRSPTSPSVGYKRLGSVGFELEVDAKIDRLTALRRPRQRRHPAANAIAPSLARANGATPLRSRRLRPISKGPARPQELRRDFQASRDQSLPARQTSKRPWFARPPSGWTE